MGKQRFSGHMFYCFLLYFLCWIKPRILPSHHETLYYLLIVCNRVPILCFSGGSLFPMGCLQLLQVSTRWVWRLGWLLWASCLLRLETKWKLQDIYLYYQKNEIQHIRSATIFKWSFFVSKKLKTVKGLFFQVLIYSPVKLDIKRGSCLQKIKRCIR